MKSTRSWPRARSSSASSAAIARSVTPRERPRQEVVQRRVGGLGGTTERVELRRVLAGSQRAHHRSGGRPGSARHAGLQREQVRAPDAVPDGDPAAGRQPAGHDGVRILAVSPPHDLEPAGARRVERERTLEHRHEQSRGRARYQRQQRRPLERHRPVAHQVGEVGRRGDDQRVEITLLQQGQGGRNPAPVVRAHGQTFNRICWGTTWKVTGVVPSGWPSATTGSARGDATSIFSLARSSLMFGSGKWSPWRKILGSMR